MGDRCRAIDQIVHENEQALGPTNKSALFEMPLPSHFCLDNRVSHSILHQDEINWGHRVGRSQR
jgi:hypothetical protein